MLKENMELFNSAAEVIQGARKMFGGNIAFHHILYHAKDGKVYGGLHETEEGVEIAKRGLINKYPNKAKAEGWEEALEEVFLNKGEEYIPFIPFTPQGSKSQPRVHGENDGYHGSEKEDFSLPENSNGSA